MSLDEIEARVNERRMVPKSRLQPLSPAALAIFEEARRLVLLEHGACGP